MGHYLRLARNETRRCHDSRTSVETETKMPLNQALGCFVLTLGAEARIVVNKYDPSTEGTNFLDLAADDASRETWSEAYKTVFAMHEDQRDLRVSALRSDGAAIDIVSDMIWGKSDTVLLYAQRVWPRDLLTDRERSVLQLMASGISTKTMSDLLGMSQDNARATMSRIRKKVDVQHDEGLAMAAIYFTNHSR